MMVADFAFWSLLVLAGITYEVLLRRASLPAAYFTSVAFVRLVLVAHAMFRAIPWSPVLLSLCIAGLLSIMVAGIGMWVRWRRLHHGIEIESAMTSIELMLTTFLAIMAFDPNEGKYLVSDPDWVALALSIIAVLVAAPFYTTVIIAAKRAKRAKEQS